MRTTTVTVLACLALAACRTVSSPPDEIGHQILTALGEDRSGDAARAFERVEDEADYRERIYPVLYDGARQSYAAGELDDALEVLRFTSARYPDGTSVRVALAYSLFLEYAESPGAGLRRELDGTLAELRGREVALPAWVDLIDAQLAIDEERPGEARESFERFVAAWDGRPESILGYVEDVGRYLASH